MQKIAFIDADGVILVNGEAKSLSLPTFTRNYDTDMVVGVKFTRPVARSIQAAELTIALKDHTRNKSFLRFVEKAFNESRIVTLMILSVEVSSNPQIATSDAEFYSGFVDRPSRSISPDKADDGEIKMQIADAWRTENGVVAWRLPVDSDSISVDMVYG